MTLGLTKANQTSFKKGQKFLPDGTPIGHKPPGWHSWNKGVRQWPDGLPDEIKSKISLALKGRSVLWLRKDPATKICKICNKEFEVHPPGKVQKRITCSYQCANKYRHQNGIYKLISTKTTRTNRIRGHYEKARIRMIDGGAVKARNASIPPTKFQKEIYEQVKIVYPDAYMEKWIRTDTGVKAVDIFIPSKNICIECDGYYWHKDREAIDIPRQLSIESLGYRVIRVPEKDWNKERNIYHYI